MSTLPAPIRVPSTPHSAAVDRDPRDRGVASVGNGLRLIEALATVQSAGISDLARQLSMSRPAVDRLLVTLMGHGYVERVLETRKYRLTVKIVAVGNSLRDRVGLIDVVRPQLVKLAELFRETVNLGILSGGNIMYVDSIPSSKLIRIEPTPGTALPAYCTALGKVILAHRSQTDVERYLNEFQPSPYTPQTIVTAKELLDRISRARIDGFAIDRGELVEELYCVASPIVDKSGVALAAISITAVKSEFVKSQPEMTSAVIEAAHEASAAVSQAMSP